MSFEDARFLSEVLHYVISIGGTLLFLIINYKNFIKVVVNIYLLFIAWGLLTFFMQGCPITLFENFISEKIYGKPFYPDYQFNGSDFYYLVHNEMFYVPFILGAVALMIRNRYRDV